MNVCAPRECVLCMFEVKCVAFYTQIVDVNANVHAHSFSSFNIIVEYQNQCVFRFFFLSLSFCEHEFHETAIHSILYQSEWLIYIS